MKYCLRCGHEFNKLYDLNKHLDKKYKCNSLYLNIPVNCIKYKYDIYLPLFNDIKNINYINNNLSHKQIKIKCNRCNKTFSMKCNYYRHMKYTCKGYSIQQRNN